MPKSVVRGRRKKRPSAEFPNDGVATSARPKKRRLVLCASCTLMFSDKGLVYLNFPDGFAHHTLDQLEISGTNGCPLCQLIFDLVSWQGGGRWEPDARLIFRNQSTTSGEGVPGIHVLQGTLENAPDIIRIYPFAKASKLILFLHGLSRASII